MKQKLLAGFMTVCLILTLLPVTVLAEGDWAEVDSAESLSEALSAGGNIQLTQDITVDSVQEWIITEDVVLDLNDHAITSTFADSNYYIMTINGGSLTVTDNSTNKGGKISATDPDYGYGIRIRGTGSRFTLEAGTIETTQESLEIYDLARDAAITIDGGKLISSGDNVLGVRGTGTEVHITGGTFESSGQCGVYISSLVETDPDSIVFTMTGGTLTHIGGINGAIQVFQGATVTIGGTASITASVCAVNVQGNAILNVEDGNLKTTNTENAFSIKSSDTSTVNISGGTIENSSRIDSAIESSGSSVVNISGGKFEIDSAGPIVRAEDNTRVTITGGTFNKSKVIGGPLIGDGSATIIISGGTFTSSAYGNIKDYLTSGVKWDEDTYKVIVLPEAAAMINGVAYLTLQEAVDAAGAGETVTLRHDVTLTGADSAGKATYEGAITIDKPIILDGDGNSITADDTFGDTNILHVVNSGEVTIQDLTVNGGGNSRHCINVHTGVDSQTTTDLTLEDVITTGGKSGVNNGGSKVTIRGEDTEIGTGAWYAVGVDNTSSSANDPSLTVKDGTIGTIKLENSDASDADVFTVSIEGGSIEAVTTAGDYIDVEISGGTVGTVTIAEGTGTGSTTTITGGTITRVTNDGDGSIDITSNVDISAGAGECVVIYKIDGETVFAGAMTVTPDGVDRWADDLPTKDGYRFSGWVCETAGITEGSRQNPDGSATPVWKGVEAGETYVFNASWVEKDSSHGSSSGGSSSSSRGDYAVTVDAGKHGDVTVSPKQADKGDTVTITVDPDKGYEVGEVTVTDKNGDSVRVKDRGDGEYTFTMPGSKVTVKVTFVEERDELPFVDVAADAYYYDAVAWAVANGVTGGTTATTFSPNSPCTRAQTVTFLWRAAGMPQAVNRVNPFTDVSESDYYYEAVLWAVENGITGGTTATTFGPGATCTRAQVATFLWRYSKDDASTLPNFTDVAEGDYFYSAVAWAVENGVTTGVTDSTFQPANPCTRGQIVTFLYRYMGK